MLYLRGGCVGVVRLVVFSLRGNGVGVMGLVGLRYAALVSVGRDSRGCTYAAVVLVGLGLR